MPDKLQLIHDWANPMSLQDIRKFFGLMVSTRDISRITQKKAERLTRLLGKTRLFEWTLEHEQAFNTLKHKMMHSATLTYPDIDKRHGAERGNVNASAEQRPAGPPHSRPQGTRLRLERAKKQRPTKGGKKKARRRSKNWTQAKKTIQTFIKEHKNTQNPLRILPDTPTYCTLS